MLFRHGSGGRFPALARVVPTTLVYEFAPWVKFALSASLHGLETFLRTRVADGNRRLLVQAECPVCVTRWPPRLPIHHCTDIIRSITRTITATRGSITARQSPFFGLGAVGRPVFVRRPEEKQHHHAGDHAENLHPLHFETLPFRQKKPRHRAGVGLACAAALVVAAHDPEDIQQADEDVEDAQVQAVGGHDVVGLATADDAAGVEQD